MVRISGSRRWATVDLKAIADVDVSFSMVSYNPIRQNPSVLAETLLQMIPFLIENPNVDIRRLTEDVVSGLGMPTNILLPEEEVAARVEAEATAAQQQARGGAAAPADAAAGIPPELMAMLAAEEGLAEGAPEEALAAGGGAPIRGEA